jgi:hypothetical protein
MQKHIMLICIWAHSLFCSDTFDIAKNVSIFSRMGNAIAGMFLARANPFLSAKAFILPNAFAHLLGISEYYFGKNKISNMVSPALSFTSIAGGLFFFAATNNLPLRAFIVSSSVQNSTMLFRKMFENQENSQNIDFTLSILSMLASLGTGASVYMFRKTSKKTFLITMFTGFCISNQIINLQQQAQRFKAYTQKNIPVLSQSTLFRGE